MIQYTKKTWTKHPCTKKLYKNVVKKRVKNYFLVSCSLTKPIANTANKAIKKHLITNQHPAKNLFLSLNK